MAEQQAVERARLCDRLETMWQGLQQDVEYQRETSERGVDPRSQGLQLPVIKLQATLWRLRRRLGRRWRRRLRLRRRRLARCAATGWPPRGRWTRRWRSWRRSWRRG